MHPRQLFFLGLAALLLVSPAPLRAWQLRDSRLYPVTLPPKTHIVRPATVTDFDEDGNPETLTISRGQASLQTGGQIRWQSPSTWEVRQAEIADLNRDGLPEAILLVWRTFKPWPVDTWLPRGGRIKNFHDSTGRSCHLILIGWQNGRFRERWAGSALAEPVRAFAAADLAGNGKQFLVTLEASYDDPLSAPARQLKVWEWNGFGFTVVSQISGAFDELAIARDSTDQRLILAP